MALLSERARVFDKRRDDNGVLRLILPTPSVGEVLEETVGHIAIYAAHDRFVMAGLRRVLAIVERNMSNEIEMAILTRLRQDLDSRERAKSAGRE
jgi:uncharacterized membrane protein